MKNSVLKFSTKAGTLQQLEGRLALAKVLPSFVFSVAAWERESDALLAKACQSFTSRRLIVRSSAAVEDGPRQSLAGRFVSVGQVERRDMAALRRAVEQVIPSYAGVGTPQTNEVLIQPQLENIRLKGVLLTASLAEASPYYVVNYEEGTPDYNSITAAKKNPVQTYLRFRDSPHPAASEDLERAINAAQELEKIFDNRFLDIEFAIDAAGDFYLFQVRPLAVDTGAEPLSQEAVGEALRKISKKFQKISAPYPYLYGDRTLLGVMPDWNPAEMIGARPRILALSLYRELITDSVWAYQRDNYGYKNLRSFPLMRSLMGIPFIDVRVTFNSFVPKDLGDPLSHKLVNYYLQTLERFPNHHDKVEFKIVFSCYFLNLSSKLKSLLDFGFTSEELEPIRLSLLNLTQKILDPKEGHFVRDLEKLSQLPGRQKKILESSLPAVDKIYWLLEDGKRYGTLPFAGVARAAFIARQFLHSLVETGIFSPKDQENFLASLNTVARQFCQDLARYRRGSLSREEFLVRYGHLRPGTYDILSPRYDEAFDRYFSTPGVGESPAAAEKKWEPSAQQKKRMDEALRRDGFSLGADALLAFMKRALEAREYGKFLFTKSVSEALRILESFGNRFGFSREDLSFLNIGTVLDLYAAITNDDLPEILGADIARHRREYKVAQAIKLPQLIVKESDLYDFFLGDSEPTFVSGKRVTAPVALEKMGEAADLAGKILLIESCDPGFDWIFSKNIAGLITAYGGANSHVAIRAAELQLPAAIGVGESHFEMLARAKVLELDGANYRVRVVE